MGDTPSAQIAMAHVIGIQQLVSVILALLARLNVGTAMRAVSYTHLTLPTIGG